MMLSEDKRIDAPLPVSLGEEGRQCGSCLVQRAGSDCHWAATPREDPIYPRKRDISRDAQTQRVCARRGSAT